MHRRLLLNLRAILLHICFVAAVKVSAPPVPLPPLFLPVPCPFPPLLPRLISLVIAIAIAGTLAVVLLFLLFR
jgi:hypothetical protein